MLGESLAPLLEQRLPIGKNEGGNSAGRDCRAGNDRLAGARRRDEHAESVTNEVRECDLLLCIKF